MLFKETECVYCENHTKHIDGMRFVDNITRFLVFQQMVDIYLPLVFKQSKLLMKSVNTLEKYAAFFFFVGCSVRDGSRVNPSGAKQRIPSWQASSYSIRKFSGFYGTRKFITVFTTARRSSLSSARSIQYFTSHFLKFYCNVLPSPPWSSKWSLSFRFFPPKLCVL